MQLKIVHRAVKKGNENSTSTKVLDPATGNEVGALVSLSMVGPVPDSFELLIETASPVSNQSAGTTSGAASTTPATTAAKQ